MTRLQAASAGNEVNADVHVCIAAGCVLLQIRKNLQQLAHTSKAK